jgi:hypothetical protein
MKILNLCFFLLGVCSCAWTQDTDTTALAVPVHSVRKATIYSAVLPGLGQIYNHRAMPKGKKNAYWKVPLIYAGLGGTGYLMLKNAGLQKELKAEFDHRQHGGAPSTKWANYDDEGVLTLYSLHLNRRDLFILAFGAVYLIQVVDAAVEAHFVTFDISEDLSMHIHPTMMDLHNPGLKVSFNFHERTCKPLRVF